MPLKIRLARGGKKGHPRYSVVVAESTSPRDGKFIEIIGNYNPEDKGDTSYKIDQEKLEYWLSVGAKPTDRISGVMRSKYPVLEKFYKAPVVDETRLNKSKKALKIEADEKAAADKKRKAEKAAAATAAAA